MAILTLRNIHANPDYVSGQTVKISRTAVRATVILSSLALYSNRVLKWLFAAASRGLPLESAGDDSAPPGARLASDRVG